MGKDKNKGASESRGISAHIVRTVECSKLFSSENREVRRKKEGQRVAENIETRRRSGKPEDTRGL